MADEKKPPNKAVNSIIIRDLSYHCNEADLIDLFQRVNVTWSSLKVERGENHNHSLLHAFVETATHEEAVHLINTLQGTKLIGRVMKLQLCKDSQGSGNSSIAAMPTGSIEAEKSRYQIHVKYQSQPGTPGAAQQGKVTEETIEQLYQQYGEIEDVVVKRHHEEYDQYGHVSRQNGYGFLYFKNPESSFFVVEKVPQLILNNSIVFTCCFSYKAAETITHKQSHHNHHNNHSRSQSRDHHQVPPPPNQYSPPRGPISDSGSTSLDDRSSVNPPPLVSNYVPQPGAFTPPPPTSMQQVPTPMQTQGVPEYFVLPPFLPSPRTNPNMPQPYLPSTLPLPPPPGNQAQQYLPPNQTMIPPPAGNVAYLYPPMQQPHQLQQQQQQFMPRNMLPLPPNSNFHSNGGGPPTMNQPTMMFTAQGQPMFNISGSLSPVSSPSTPSPPPSSFAQHFTHAMSAAAGHPHQEQSFPRGMIPRQAAPPQYQQPQPGVPYQVPMSQQMQQQMMMNGGQQPFPRQQLPQFQHPPRPGKGTEREQQGPPVTNQPPFTLPQYQPPPHQQQFFQPPQFPAQIHQQMHYQPLPQVQYPPFHQHPQYQPQQMLQQQPQHHHNHPQQPQPQHTNYNNGHSQSDHHPNSHNNNHNNNNLNNHVNGHGHASRQHGNGKGNDRRSRGPPARYDPPNNQQQPHNNNNNNNHQQHRRQHHDNHRHHVHQGHYQHQSNHNNNDFTHHYNHHNHNNNNNNNNINNHHHSQGQSREEDEEDCYHHNEHVEENNNNNNYNDQMKPSSSSSPPNLSSDYPNPSND